MQRQNAVNLASSHLDSRLTQVHPPRQFLPHECVRIVRPLEHSLKRCELTRRESGSVAARLLPFPVVSVHNVVFFCEGNSGTYGRQLCLLFCMSLSH